MWAEQQFAKRRQKRGYLPLYPPFETDEFNEAEENRPLKRVKRKSVYPSFQTEESETERDHIRNKQSPTQSLFSSSESSCIY